MTPTNELLELQNNERIRNRIRVVTRTSLQEQTGVRDYNWRTLENLKLGDLIFKPIPKTLILLKYLMKG